MSVATSATRTVGEDVVRCESRCTFTGVAMRGQLSGSNRRSRSVHPAFVPAAAATRVEVEDSGHFAASSGYRNTARVACGPNRIRRHRQAGAERELRVGEAERPERGGSHAGRAAPSLSRVRTGAESSGIRGDSAAGNGSGGKRSDSSRQRAQAWSRGDVGL
jgi:hypothetical protein